MPSAVGLMPDVPDQAILGSIENVVQRDREFDRAQPGGKVTTSGAHGLHQELPELGGQ